MNGVMGPTAGAGQRAVRRVHEMTLPSDARRHVPPLAPPPAATDLVHVQPGGPLQRPAAELDASLRSHTLASGHEVFCTVTVH